MKIIIFILSVIIAISTLCLIFAMISDLKEKDKEFKRLAREVPESYRALINAIDRLIDSKK
jgi:flagellar basal body-associated protein FliL